MSDINIKNKGSGEKEEENSITKNTKKKIWFKVIKDDDEELIEKNEEKKTRKRIFLGRRISSSGKQSKCGNDSKILYRLESCNDGEVKKVKSRSFKKFNKFKSPTINQKTEKSKNVKRAILNKEKGNLLFVNKEYSKALEMFSAASLLNPEEPAYYLNMAACHHELKNYDKAIKNCLLAINLTTNFKKRCKAYGRIGFAFKELGDYKKAKENFLLALVEHADPRLKKAINELPNEVEEDFEKEEKESEVLVDNESQSNQIKVKVEELAEEYNLQGNDLFNKGNFKEAEKLYLKASKLNTKIPKYYTNRAMCLIKLMSYKEALVQCEKALEINFNFLRAHQRKCKILILMNKHYKALDWFKIALNIFPDDLELKENYYSCLKSINNKENEIERLEEAKNDPEIQLLMKDPRVIQFLKELEENPDFAHYAITKDEFLRDSYIKLKACGVIREME